MSDTKPSSDLSALESDYTILGELNGPCDARSYIAKRKDTDTAAKRRDDDTNVLITVVTTPKGDEGNALSHLAADTKVLAGVSHRRLIPVLDGRWLGDDAFAVITQRVNDPTLAEKLAEGESFTNPRVAAILREVNALLEWGRDQKVVHRNVTADRIHLEPKTDRVRITFGAKPIARVQQVDPAADDARTIAALAVAMLTGDVDANAGNGTPLTELRADLPQKLRDETAKLLDESQEHTAEHVASYLALIGMADPLFVGEEEEKRIRADILEEQRVERGKLVAERTEFEMLMAAERKKFDEFMTKERNTLAEERASLARAVALKRTKYQKAIAAERTALETMRTQQEQAVAKQRAELERVAAEDRRQIEALRVELKRAGDLEIEKKRDASLAEIGDDESTLDQPEFATPMFVAPVIEPLERLTFNDASIVMSDEDVEFPLSAGAEEAREPEAPQERTIVVTPVNSKRKRWIVSSAIAGTAAIIAVSAVLLGTRNTATTPAPAAIAQPVTTAPVAPAPAPLVSAPADSTAANAPSGAPAVTTVDSSAGTVARTAAAAKAEVPVVKPKPKPVVRDTVVPAARRDSVPIESIFDFRRPVTVPRRDSPPNADSVARRDTTTP